MLHNNTKIYLTMNYFEIWGDLVLFFGFIVIAIRLLDFFHLLSINVRVDKEIKEEHEIAQVHQERVFYVFFARVALGAALFGRENQIVHIASDYHLSQLTARYQNGDLVRHVYAHGF